MESREGIPCPISMENPEPELVERMVRRRREREARREAESNQSFCLILGKVLTSSRLGSLEWCSCGSCVPFTTIRENICCREALESEERCSEALKGLQDKMKECEHCIVRHPEFYGVVLHPPVLRMLMRNLRYERKKQREAIEDENKSLRYCAYRAFVFWCYGQLGMNRRYEIPACVRSAIMEAYPSSSGVYVGFRASGTSAVRDSEEWRESAV